MVRKEGSDVQAVLKTPTPLPRRKGSGEADAADLEALIAAMGKRLQAEYIEGAIPYLRTHEPEVWAKLEQLDREESLDALVEYELLFFEGLHRYVNFLNGERKAA
jgi:hypothetical protein